MPLHFLSRPLTDNSLLSYASHSLKIFSWRDVFFFVVAWIAFLLIPSSPVLEEGKPLHKEGSVVGRKANWLSWRADLVSSATLHSHYLFGHSDQTRSNFQVPTPKI
ncbi:hypothetical protein DPMN_020631 [Dreissena polymorpha]|uniref:Uncharacterized protein n=1 Tax=Dreissena polymorpha TaxID=45954 RepID=A0A9D4NMH6_DREPO|nr:hypothetical protein DPMN_020631 [Dreissena polymorpha]